MKLSKIRGLALDHARSGEHDEHRLASWIIDLVRREQQVWAVLLQWANHLAHDVIAEDVRRPGRLPRAAYVSPGQEPMPWGMMPAALFPEIARRYISKYQYVVERCERLSRILAIVEPWMAVNDATTLTTTEVAILAGAAEEDILALSA